MWINWLFKNTPVRLLSELFELLNMYRFDCIFSSIFTLLMGMNKIYLADGKLIDLTKKLIII